MFATEYKFLNPDYLYLDIQYLLEGRQIGGYSRDWIRDPSYAGGGEYGAEHRRVGDSVYFKWQHRSTRQIYEQTVRLKGRLPVPVEEGGKLWFIVDQGTLYVYMASAWKKGLVPCLEKHAISTSNPTPDNRAAASLCNRLAWKIYPEQKQLNFYKQQ